MYKDPLKLIAYKKEYMKKYNPKYWSEHRTQRLEKRRLMGLWIDEIKAKRGCDKCTESNPVCLDFHHRDQHKKERKISDLINRKSSKKHILAEIEKCDLLCANCHRKQHIFLPVSN